MFERFQESLKNFFFKEENQAFRDARAVNRTEQQEALLQIKESKAEELGDLDHITILEKRMSLMDKKELIRLFDQLIQLRLLIHEILKGADQIRFLIHTDLKHDQLLNKEEKDKIAREFDAKFIEIHAMLEKFINELFQSETSFTNASMQNVIERLQKTDVVVRSLFYDYREAKKETRGTRKLAAKLESKARHLQKINDEKFNKDLREYLARMKSEMTFLKKAANDTILVLQDKNRDIEEKKAHFKQLLNHAHFPHIVGEAIVKQFDDNLTFIQERLHNEVQMKRTELSDIERSKFRVA